MIPTSNSVKRVYEQVLFEVPQIDHRRFIHRFNQAVNELALKYPVSMDIVGFEIDTSNPINEWVEFDDTGLYYLNLEAFDEDWESIITGNSIQEVTVGKNGIVPHVFPLPNNCAGIYKVFLVKDGKLYECKDYQVNEGGIIFPFEGIFRVYYYRKTEIQTINDTVTLPWQFFNAIAYFIIGNELLDTNENKALFFMQRYEDSANSAYKNLISRKRKNKRIKTPLWR